MPVRMGVQPADGPIVNMLMMLVVNVQMFMILFDMPVRQNDGIVRGVHLIK